MAASSPTSSTRALSPLLRSTRKASAIHEATETGQERAQTGDAVEGRKGHGHGTPDRNFSREQVTLHGSYSLRYLSVADKRR